MIGDETVLMDGIELREVEIGHRRRWVPIDIGTSDPEFGWEDLLVDDFYCQHDTFTGSPWGADYSCPWCMKEQKHGT